VSGFPHDPLMLEAQRGDCSLHIVAGRQIVTAERIEVHALAMRQTIADGQTLRATLEEVRASDALVVLPWGVGKWLGRRGRLVAEALAADLGTVWLSDNGGRPWFWRDALLARAPAAGRPVLRGSDPLPLPGEERRVGSFGCWLRGSVATAAALIARIRSSTPADLHPYGNSESLARFLRNQSALRLRRRDGG
jgi:hypothetical protein